MLNEICEISYKTKNGTGLIWLDCSAENFDETLREIEQTLADTHVKDLVYTYRPRRADDFPIDDENNSIEQLSLLLTGEGK